MSQCEKYVMGTDAQCKKIAKYRVHEIELCGQHYIAWSKGAKMGYTGAPYTWDHHLKDLESAQLTLDG